MSEIEAVGLKLTAVRTHVGLLVECHGRVGRSDAIKRGSALEDLRRRFCAEACRRRTPPWSWSVAR